MILVRLILFYSIISFLFSSDNRLKIIQADVMESKQIDNETVTELAGDVILERKGMRLYTEKAINYTVADVFHLVGPVKMIEEQDTLICKNMIFFSDSLSYLLATGDVTYLKAEDKINCDSLYYWTDLDSGLAVGNVRMVQAERLVETDFFNYKDTDGERGMSFSAYRNVTITEAERLIFSDTLRYDDNRELLSLQNGGNISERDKGVSGDNIQIQYKNSLMDIIDVSGNANAWQDIDIKIDADNPKLYSFRNEMSGKHMHVQFADDTMKIMNLLTMAITHYHVIQDSLLIGMNTVSGDTVIMDFESGNLDRIRVIGGSRGEFHPEKGNAKVDTTVIYSAEFIDYKIDQEQTTLLGMAEVEYEDTRLTAGNIKVDWRTNILDALQEDGVLPTVYSGTNEPLVGDNMVFDMVARHGKVDFGQTEYNSGFYYGDQIYRDDPDVFHVNESVYTSCELENPHFYFTSNRMKMVGNDRVIAKPLILFIYDIPIIGIPFAVFPNKGGKRHSGWIMPSFGTEGRRGTFFQGLGYYWAPNDYIDHKLKFNFFDKLGLFLNSMFHYKKRYVYSGSISTNLRQTINEKDITNLFSSFFRQYSVNWNHSQKMDPTQNLFIRGTYASGGFHQSEWSNEETRLTQKLESSAKYSKSWVGTKNSIIINISDSYDLMAMGKRDDITNPGYFLVERSQNLPNVSFTHGKSRLAEKGGPLGFLNNVFWDYSNSLTQNRRLGWVLRDSTLHWENEMDSSSFGFGDSTVLFWQDSINVKSRMQHKSSLSTSGKFFGWLSLSPRISFSESWITTYTELDDNYNLKYVDGFKRRLTWSSSLSATTKLYGLFPVSLGSVDALRHVMTPSVSFSWSPDFSKSLFGDGYSPHFQTFEDTVLVHDYFSNTLAGKTPTKESKSMGFSLGNQFQAKLKNSDGDYSKVDLFSWRLSTNYNFMADSLNLSPINSGIRSTLPMGFALDVSMTHDMYAKNKYGQRYNKMLSKPRLKSISASTSIKLQGSRTSDPEQADSTANSVENETEVTTQDIDIGGYDNNTIASKLWDASFSLRYSYTPRTFCSSIDGTETCESDPLINFWINANSRIQLTEKWSLTYRARFDLENKELVSQGFTLERPLHCFDFYFNWIPSGYNKGYYLKINVRNPDLSDIKLESRGGKKFWEL